MNSVANHDAVGLRREGGSHFEPNDGRDGASANRWRIFIEKVTCNDGHILKSNEAKVQVNGEKLLHYK